MNSQFVSGKLSCSIFTEYFKDIHWVFCKFFVPLSTVRWLKFFLNTVINTLHLFLALKTVLKNYSCCLGDFVIVYKSSRWEIINKKYFLKNFANIIPRKATVKTIFHFQSKYTLKVFLSDNSADPYRRWNTRAELNPF